jgi:uncharacterized protein
MPRRVFIKFRPLAARMRNSWYFRMLGPRLTDSRLWSVNRRAITSAFGAGIAIQFVPLPGHLVMGLIAAIVWRLNVPAMVGSLLIVNPFTAVPIYYFAYRVGALLVGEPAGQFTFELSWDWLQNGLGELWKPFLVGCLVCGVLGGYFSYQLLELLWRISTLNKLKEKRGNVRP